VPAACTVLVAAADVLNASTARVARVHGEVLPFSDREALRALETIIERRPEVIALERLFAASPRGAALINRIKADPMLVDAEIRVIAHDSDYLRVARPSGAPVAAPAPAAGGAESGAVAVAVIAAPAAAGAQPLDYRGTRREQRFRIPGERPIVVDGTEGRIVDLSKIGVQLLSPNSLKPNQRVRLSLQDENGLMRFNGSIAWASFEIPAKTGPRYRAGIEFVDGDSAAIEDFIRRQV
jgi:hypothetical protein